jgi:hypothetical protein
VLVAALSSGAEAFAPASSFGGLRLARSAVCVETRPFSIHPAAARSLTMSSPAAATAATGTPPSSHPLKQQRSAMVHPQALNSDKSHLQ